MVLREHKSEAKTRSVAMKLDRATSVPTGIPIKFLK